jgi:hypothetical protein
MGTRRAVLSACVSALLFSTAIAAFAAPFNNKKIRGSYVCSATGGFISSNARALILLAADGKGNVLRGSLIVATDSAGTTGNGAASPSQGSPWFDFRDDFGQCKYSASGGMYSVNSDGTATMAVNWTANGGNPSTPLDCSENLVAHYDLILQSSGVFFFLTRDPLAKPVTATNFANLGEALSGSCSIQSAK